ncbi:hypothetical protein [Caproiciproducens sp. LBM24188]
MKEKPEIGKADKSKIYFFEAIKKHSFVLLAVLVALAGCDFSNEAKSSAGGDFLYAISRFINSHSSSFFLIIFVILIAQLVAYFIVFNNDNNTASEELEILEEKQKSEIIRTKKIWSDALSNINELNSKFPADRDKSLSKLKDEKNKINACLKDVKTAYILNRSDYKFVHGKLYRCINKVCKNLDDRLKSLLDQYSNESNRR